MSKNIKIQYKQCDINSQEIEQRLFNALNMLINNETFYEGKGNKVCATLSNKGSRNGSDTICLRNGS